MLRTFLGQKVQATTTTHVTSGANEMVIVSRSCCYLTPARCGHPSLRVGRLITRNFLIASQIASLPRIAKGLAFSSLPGRIPLFREAEFAMSEATNAWCSTASINPVSDAIDIQKISGFGDANHAMKTFRDRTFDLTTGSSWMEYIENVEDRVAVEGGAGAYDVMRCDLAYSLSDAGEAMDPSWRVWGEDFHLNRLRTSFCSLLEHMPVANASTEELDQALQKSRAIVRSLLFDAHSSEIMQSLAPPEESREQDVVIQLVRVTILWTPKPTSKEDSDGLQEIIVRGHASSDCKPVQIHQRPCSIVATIALPLQKETQKVTDTLPSRFRSPQNKVASWCRLRKPLEDPQTYKPPGVGEVLMVRSVSASNPGVEGTEILEGLTSNFFVIYKDGTLRTPETGVLRGYVRHLVLDCAERAGLRLDYSPILMEDASKGLWESAFITSSSRLINPISRILIPQARGEADVESTDSGVVFREFWTDPNLVNGHDLASTPRWLKLLNEVLQEGGYETKTA